MDEQTPEQPVVESVPDPTPGPSPEHPENLPADGDKVVGGLDDGEGTVTNAGG